MTFPTQGNPSLPFPFLPNSQWQDGEPINDVRLHQRVDEPLETLGQVARNHGTNWVSFRGSKTGAITGSGTLGAALIPWTVIEDTHNGWQPLDSSWHVPINARYLISCQIAQSTSVSGVNLWLAGGTDAAGGQGNDAIFPMRSPNFEPIAGGGAGISTVMNLFTFYDICAQITATVTALSADSCWLSIQQIGWLT
jgi:hypothetical protein